MSGTGHDRGAGDPAVAYAAVCVDIEPWHLDRPFDYAVEVTDAGGLAAADGSPVVVGSRVVVLFNGRRRKGIVLDVRASTSVDAGRVLPVRRSLGEHAWVTPDEASVARWAADRWGGTQADVLRHALPKRVVAVERAAAEAGWYPTASRVDGATSSPASTSWDGRVGGPAVLAAASQGVGASAFWRPAPDTDVGAALCELADVVLERGRDVLVVVPDRGSRVADDVLTAMRDRLGPDAVVDARAGLGDRARYRAWLACRTGLGRVLVGERSVAFWPLRDLGLAAVLDEANPALKERRSPRHHVREVVLERARRADAVGLLVGTVPSAAAWALLRDGRLHVVRPERAAERRAAPVVRPVDAGRTSRLVQPSLRALGDALDDGAYGVVLATLRGEGRALVCAVCGEMVRCPRCARTPRPGADRLVCEGCGWQAARRSLQCVECRERRFRPLVAGAEQLGDELRRSFPDTTVAVLEGYDQPAPPPPALLVVTRGSVMDRAPGPVHAVAIPGVDALLRRPELDAAEDALRLVMRLADWTVQDAPSSEAGAVSDVGDRSPSRRRGRRADRVVVVQTADPEHPAVQALVGRDPGAFWREEAALRGELRLPPAGRLVQIDAPGDGHATADDVETVLATADRLLGPIPAGRGRSSLLVKTNDVARLLADLAPVRETWSRDGDDVRLDVDPVDVR